MKRNFETKARKSAFTRFTVSTSFSLLLVWLFTAVAASDTIDEMLVQAKDTHETVAWYLRGGYWRDDLADCLPQAKHVLFPNNSISASMDLEDNE